MRRLLVVLIIAGLTVGFPAGQVEAEPAAGCGTGGAYADLIEADGAIHYWRLEESTTLEAACDQGSVGGNDGKFTGGITLGHPTVNRGYAALFDGASGTFVDVGLFHPGDMVTVEAWVLLDPSASKDFHSAVARWDGSYELDIEQATGRGNFVARNDSNTFGLSATTLPVSRDEWHHLVGVFDAGGNLTIYVDGVRGSTVAMGGVLQDAGDATVDRVLIGATRNGTSLGFNWTGLIDEVAIYDYPLTGTQIAAHTAAGFARCGGKIATINMNTNGGSGTGTLGDDVIVGTPGNDVIDGLGGDDTICGFAGNDRIYGRAGADLVFGGVGNDRIIGNDGNDVLLGEDGRDRILGQAGDDTVDGGNGDDIIRGHRGVDVLRGGAGDDVIRGGSHNDQLFGDGDNDTIFGHSGGDKIWGGAGNDVIRGGPGRDTLYGESGEDLLNGGPLHDRCNGGADTDTARRCEVEVNIP